jgi:hypothetical protein
MYNARRVDALRRYGVFRMGTDVIHHVIHLIPRRRVIHHVLNPRSLHRFHDVVSMMSSALRRGCNP